MSDYYDRIKLLTAGRTSHRHARERGSGGYGGSDAVSDVSAGKANDVVGGVLDQGSSERRGQEGIHLELDTIASDHVAEVKGSGPRMRIVP